jgi:hypothetical protein
MGTGLVEAPGAGWLRARALPRMMSAAAKRHEGAPMPKWSWLLVAFGAGFGWGECALGQTPSPANPRLAYEGLWGGDRIAACRDQDGVDRLSIEANRFFWYETRCRAHGRKANGPRSWTMHMACEGEGQRFKARPRLTLASPDKLIMDDAPVGRTKRQVYVRCGARR